ncbi:MAG: holo-ACP synthase [Candidatus Krumholzibacteria bacterium]|nr:holo-ACP synthase [Candidatus Krumholzibacteria bacterium]MDP6668668.1 holo-ACP synthase [Candidatus Krumholzibacteria bacterium]MDP6796265.1 holo-ACP synthase [Candidatus Krumholzibacteria bacterium]MDP7021039.1 holo-ACP synthase [Candidatus Krumholzibacteria bacterium]
MILGTGIDLASPSRLQEAHARRGPSLLQRLFTPAEIADCQRHRNPWPGFAARFAAKEAFLKALGTGLRKGLAWKQMEVRKDDLGRPYLHCTGTAAELLQDLGARKIHLSLSHLEDLGIAQVVLEGHE